MPKIWINNGVYTCSDVAAGLFDPVCPEAHTLQFCKDWLNGLPGVTIKTSGSTGKPKYIRLYREQLLASARATLDFLKLGPADHALVCLHTGYIAGKMMLIRALLAGMDISIVPASTNPFAKLPADRGVTFSAVVPLQLQKVLTDGGQGLACFNRQRVVLAGGAPVSQQLQEQLLVLRPQIYHTYGMTETVSHIGLRKLNGKGRSDWFGKLPGIKLWQDERGCLVIQGDVTARKPVLTNDLVELQGSGRFRWRGRVDNTINSGGVKIQPEEVEALAGQVLAANGLMCRFFVAGLPDSDLGEQVCLVLETAPLPAETEQAVMLQLKNSASKYHAPRLLHYLKNFVETPTAKIDRKKSIGKILRNNG